MDLWSHPSSVDGGLTGVELYELKTALAALSKVSDGLALSKPRQRAVSRRGEVLHLLGKSENGTTPPPMIKWATAELLALSSWLERVTFAAFPARKASVVRFVNVTRHGMIL